MITVPLGRFVYTAPQRNFAIRKEPSDYREQMSLGDDEFLLDEASVAAFLAECEMADHAIPIPLVPAAGTTSQKLDCGATWSGSTSSRSSTGKAAKRKPWHQRRKEELESLREEAKQLSAKLDDVKLVSRAHPDGTSSRPIKTEVSAWEAFAEHQSKLRQMSEEENVNLREEVKNCQERAKSLQRVLKRKFRKAMNSPVVGPYKRYQLASSTVRPPSDNQAVFNELKAGMDSMYADLDNFFGRVEMDKLPCPGRRNTSMLSNTHGMLVEFMDNYAFPFDLRQTESVIWKLGDRRAQDPVGIFFLEESSEGNNTRLKSLSFPFTMGNINFRILIRSVTKKYVEDGRTVFITRSLIESVFGLASIELVETTRLVLKRGEMSLVGPVTKMQTHREAVVRGNVLTSDSIGYPCIEDGLKIWEGGVERFKYRVEDQLLRATSNYK